MRTHAAGSEGSLPPGQNQHIVQFYDYEWELVVPAAKFLFAGLKAGESLVIASTPEHAQAFVLAIESLGGDLTAAFERDRLLVLDAYAGVAAVTRNGRPDRELMRAWLEPHLGRLLQGSRNGRLCVFGELVSLLARAGHFEGALELEALWDELMSELSFSLFCAYRLADFPREADRHPFRQVCCAHGRIQPATPASILADRDRMALRIAELEQLAGTVHAEVSHRRHLEATLREMQQDLAGYSKPPS
ncbi:MAG: MEDS domain-containing protein [Myxococcales bacterium]